MLIAHSVRRKLRFCINKNDKGEKMENIVLVMLSGGRDSFLATCRLLDSPNNYSVKMVTYDNGCSYQSGNAKMVAERIIQQYGAQRAEYLGVYKIGGIIREFFFPYFNLKPEEQMKLFAGLTPSQFHCLICRTSMYIYSVWLCKKYGISYLAEGGRKVQQFVVELPGMIKERYPAMLKRENIELLLPVYELEDDWERDNELLRRNFLCKSYEAKCMVGVPIRGSVDESVIEGVHNYFDQVVLKRIEELELLSEKNCLLYLDKQYDELQQ